jgi:Cys-tRNA(Pro) deacylase
MVNQESYPITPGVRMLRSLGIPFRPRVYSYQEHGGTALAAATFKVSEHAVIKTLVFTLDDGRHILLLMHGDFEVSVKNLARILRVKHVELCDEAEAHRRTGYVFGGTSPFGIRTPIPVYAEKTIFELPSILINGGKRGFLVEIDPKDLKKAFPVIQVDAAISAD